MSRSLKIKAVCGGLTCLALVVFDIISGIKRAWDIENLVKDVILVAAVVIGVLSEQRYYSRLAQMSQDQRDRQLADKLPEDRKKILLKLKEYDA